MVKSLAQQGIVGGSQLKLSRVFLLRIVSNHMEDPLKAYVDKGVDSREFHLWSVRANFASLRCQILQKVFVEKFTYRINFFNVSKTFSEIYFSQLVDFPLTC